MEEWKTYKLGEICTKIGSGATPKGGKEAYLGGDTSLIRSQNVLDFSFSWDGLAYINEDQASKLDGVEIERNDVLLNITGDSVARACIVPDDALPARVNQHVAIIRGNHSMVLNEYILYFLQFKKQNLLSLSQGGATRNALTKGMIENLDILLPELSEQKRIISILKSLDEKIGCNRRLNDNFILSFLLLACFVLWLLKLRNDNLEQQAQALFKSWFVDFEPFKDGEFVESEKGMIPKGWIVGDIYNYVDVIYGAPYKSSMFNENKEGLPLIRIRDLKTNSPQFFTPEILPNTEYIDAGDIIAGMDAEFAPYLWLGEKGVLNQRCCKFKAKNNSISNYYILFLVKPELEYVQSYKTGTTVSHLGKSDIDRFKFIIPPLDVVLAFSKKVNYMKEEVVNRARESRRLAQLRDTLLPRLMSGELKVNEIEMH